MRSPMPANMVVPPEDHVGVQVLTDVHITFHNALECRVMDAACLLANEAGLEEDFGAAEALAADGNDVAIWQLVSLLLVRALCSCLHLGVIIQCDVRQLLL